MTCYMCGSELGTETIRCPACEKRYIAQKIKDKLGIVARCGSCDYYVDINKEYPPVCKKMMMRVSSEWYCKDFKEKSDG